LYEITTKSLIDAKSGKVVWDEDYDREMDDIFAIQTELAELIADKLNASITISEKNNIAKRPTQNLEAYDQFLRGRTAWNKGGDSALRKGIDFFKQAIKLDSSYSRAYSGLADCYSALGYNSFELPSNAYDQYFNHVNQKALLLISFYASIFIQLPLFFSRIRGNACNKCKANISQFIPDVIHSSV
jgi:adenylate cyclase